MKEKPRETERKGGRERGRERDEHRYKGKKQVLSITTLNVNGTNAPIKRHSIAEWIRKHNLLFSVYKKPTSEQKIYTG